MQAEDTIYLKTLANGYFIELTKQDGRTASKIIEQLSDLETTIYELHEKVKVQ